MSDIATSAVPSSTPSSQAGDGQSLNTLLVNTNIVRDAGSSPPHQILPFAWRPEQRVVHVLKQMRGSSGSVLIECEDGRYYILKLNGNRVGPNLLANDSLGTHLLRNLGFRAPKAVPVILGPEVLSDPGIIWAFKPQAGLHLAIEFLGDSEHQLVGELPLLLRTSEAYSYECLGLHIFDVLMSHQDYREIVYTRHVTHRIYLAHPIDNGHLFGGVSWAHMLWRSTTKPLHLHTLAEEAVIDEWISYFQRMIPDLLQAAIFVVPTQWYCGDIAILADRILQRLDHLKNLVRLDLTRYTWPDGRRFHLENRYDPPVTSIASASPLALLLASLNRQPIQVA